MLEITVTAFNLDRLSRLSRSLSKAILTVLCWTHGMRFCFVPSVPSLVGRLDRRTEFSTKQQGLGPLELQRQSQNARFSFQQRDSEVSPTQMPSWCGVAVDRREPTVFCLSTASSLTSSETIGAPRPRYVASRSKRLYRTLGWSPTDPQGLYRRLLSAQLTATIVPMVAIDARDGHFRTNRMHWSRCGVRLLACVRVRVCSCIDDAQDSSFGNATDGKQCNRRAAASRVLRELFASVAAAELLL